MLNLELAAEAPLIIHVIIKSAIGPSIVYVLGIGCSHLLQQDSMFGFSSNGAFLHLFSSDHDLF